MVNFVVQWMKGRESFEFTTSGSTGTPKSIEISRETLAYSAQQTLHFLFGINRPDTLLLCINPAFIGGTQVITRALVAGADLIVREPSSNPLTTLDQPVDLTSLVPLQVQTILRDQPDKFALIRNVLVGGAPLKASIRKKLINHPCQFYETFGMTETASHVALKHVGDDVFRPIGDTQIGSSDAGILTLRGTLTKNEWLTTNDLIEQTDSGFKWIGRGDWVINSGGVKLSPEMIEDRIHETLPETQVIVSSKPDGQLGERAILITEKEILAKVRTMNILQKYEIPKEEFLVAKLPINENGKIDRLKAREMIN